MVEQIAAEPKEADYVPGLRADGTTSRHSTIRLAQQRIRAEENTDVNDVRGPMSVGANGLDVVREKALPDAGCREEGSWRTCQSGSGFVSLVAPWPLAVSVISTKQPSSGTVATTGV